MKLSIFAVLSFFIEPHFSITSDDVKIYCRELQLSLSIQGQLIYFSLTLGVNIPARRAIISGLVIIAVRKMRDH